MDPKPHGERPVIHEERTGVCGIEAVEIAGELRWSFFKDYKTDTGDTRRTYRFATHELHAYRSLITRALKFADDMNLTTD